MGTPNLPPQQQPLRRRFPTHNGTPSRICARRSERVEAISPRRQSRSPASCDSLRQSRHFIGHNVLGYPR